MNRPGSFGLGIREVVALLQARRHWRILNIEVCLEEEQDSLLLDSFVRALEQDEHLQFLKIQKGMFKYQNDAFDRLFGSVLTVHPSLAGVTFSSSGFCSEYLNMFLSSVSTRGKRLQYISLHNVELDHQGTLAIATFLSNNPQVESLRLTLCDIKTAGCKALFEALACNTHLRELELSENAISEISLAAVQALENSNLRVLTLYDRALTNQGIRTLAQGLRTNVCLENLNFSSFGAHKKALDSFQELLFTFNFTLRRLRIDGATPMTIGKLLRANCNVRKAHNSLLELDYHLSELSLWPQVLGRFSNKPSLLYRFLRRDSGELSNCLRIPGRVPANRQRSHE